MGTRSVSLAFVLVPSLAAPSFAGVTYVGPGQVHTQIQSAIDAAAPGDTLAVLPLFGPPFQYAPFILNKPLRIVSASIGSGLTFNCERAYVRDIGAGQTALISGMGSAKQLEVTNCVGDVVIADTYTWIYAAFCERLTVLNCILRGPDGGGSVCEAAPGITCVHSNLLVAGTSSTGGDESSGCFGGGAAGLAASGASDVVLLGSTLRGGKGNFGGDGVLSYGSLIRYAGGAGSLIIGGSPYISTSGGAGIHLEQGSHVTLASGAPLLGGSGPQGPGPAILADPASSYQTIPMTSPLLAAAFPVVALGGTGTLQILATPGSVVHAYFAATLGPSTSFSGIDGEVVLDLGSAMRFAALPIPAGGSANVQVAVPNDALLAGLLVWFQAVELAPGGIGIANPTALLALP